jgi:flagellar biosynthesis chaperone FliJ
MSDNFCTIQIVVPDKYGQYHQYDPNNEKHIEYMRNDGYQNYQQQINNLKNEISKLKNKQKK